MNRNAPATNFFGSAVRLLWASAFLVISGCGHHGPAPSESAGTRGWIPAVWTEYQAEGPTGSRLPDFSRAGYAMGSRPIPGVEGPVFDVTDPRFGAIPDDGRDDTAAIQAAVDAAGAAGGGVVLLPRGRYEIRKTANAPYLRITRDHVVLRGEGNGPGGTLLVLGSPGPAGAVRRLGTVPALQEPRSGAAVAVIGPEAREALTEYTESLLRGGRRVAVSDTSRLSVGQLVVIEFEDPRIDVEHPAPEKADMAAQLTHPFRLTEDQVDTFGAAGRKITWIVRIAEIPDRRTVVLAKPARFDQLLRYRPRIHAFHGVEGVGIEDLRIESRWPGNYRHHKPHVGKDGAVIRTAREQDYLWNGIWMSYAVDGWVRGITFKDLTQGVIVSHSADLTLRDLRFEGIDGHAGVTIGRSNDVLLTGAEFFARLVHPVTLTMMASGNVVTDCEAHYDGRDDETATDAVIDFHGMFPFENLFENLRGFYICPGGDMSVLPHAGVRNVFWNIEAPRRMSCYVCDEEAEFARTFAYEGTSSGTPATMYEHVPQAFFIGIRKRGGGAVAIGGDARDRRNAWMTVEGLNRPGIGIPSLYEAQRAGRPPEQGKALRVSENR